jgi:hypothetical protein
MLSIPHSELETPCVVLLPTGDNIMCLIGTMTTENDRDIFNQQKFGNTQKNSMSLREIADIYTVSFLEYLDKMK